MERSLASLGLGLDGVDLVVTAQDVVAGKPDPEACERLGADPSAAVEAEDSPAGIGAAPQAVTLTVRFADDAVVLGSPL